MGFPRERGRDRHHFRTIYNASISIYNASIIIYDASISTYNASICLSLCYDTTDGVFDLRIPVYLVIYDSG